MIVLSISIYLLVVDCKVDEFFAAKQSILKVILRQFVPVHLFGEH